MPLGYAIASIAGVALEDENNTPCKVLVVDGANLQATVVGNTEFAADGTPHTQTLETTKGAAFGLHAEFLPPSKLNAVIAAVNTAVAAGDSFQVIAEDDIHNIDAQVMPDYARGWLLYPEQRTKEATIKDAMFRFITV